MCKASRRLERFLEEHGFYPRKNGNHITYTDGKRVIGLSHGSMQEHTVRNIMKKILREKGKAAAC